MDASACLVNSFDTFVAKFVNEFVGLYPRFDVAVSYLSRNDLFKGGVLCAVLWMLWAAKGHDLEQRRLRIVSLSLACFVSLMTARFLAVTLPFRVRPLHDPQLALTLPRGMTRGALEGWSSLPSDHAALFFALAGGLWFVSRRWGLFALAYTVIVICLTRLYLGLHYPMDLLVGAAGGLLSAWVCNRPAVVHRTARPVLEQHARHPGAFHAMLFLVTYQIAEMFESTLSVIKLIRDATKLALSW